MLFSSVKLLLDWGKNIEKKLQIPLETLQQLSEEFGYTSEYLLEQWLRQRDCQLSAMENKSQRQMMEQIEELVEKEDLLQDAQ